MARTKRKVSETIQQASAIPFRRCNGQLQFCLITSVKRGRWQFPKGIIDPGETYVETALKESLEEAGIRGNIVGQPIGSYRYRKWGTSLDVTVTLMEVTQEDACWDEIEVRERRWATAVEARELIDKPELLEMLEIAIETLGEDKRVEKPF